MARPIATLKLEGIEPALLYLKRALERPGESFRHKPAVTKQSLADLEASMAAKPEIKALLFKDWVVANLTDDGRIKMLNAVRQKRVTSKKVDPTHRSLRLPLETAKQLDALAKQAGGMPVTKLLAAFAAVGSVDEKLRKQLFRLAVAINTN
jgi:hypothetical protein